MRELFLVLGIFIIIVALDLQPWHRQYKLPFGLLGLTMVIVTLSTYSSKALLIIPIGGLLAMIWHLCRHWQEYQSEDEEMMNYCPPQPGKEK